MHLIRHKTRRAKFTVGLPVILALQFLFLVFGLNQNPMVSHFTIGSDKITGEIRLMLITDLHSCAYGQGQGKLLKMVDGENPDLVLLGGDIFDDVLPPDRTIEFLQGVADKYPCYFTFGNHEFWSGKIDEFKTLLTELDIKVLRGTTDIAGVKGEKISISGIDDPATDGYDSNSPSYADQLRSLAESPNSDAFTLLISHRPEVIGDFLPLGFDLVLAGHGHGGQWRIPLILENGLLAPNQGFFPKYTNGEYHLGNTVLIVSRGLARESTAVPRIFNRPELVMITLRGGK